MIPTLLLKSQIHDDEDTNGTMVVFATRAILITIKLVSIQLYVSLNMLKKLEHISSVGIVGRVMIDSRIAETMIVGVFIIPHITSQMYGFIF